MNVSFAAILVLLAQMFVSSANAQGFAGLGSNEDGYADVVAGKSFAFPADHGAHYDFRIEWWYITANLEDAAGTQYGIQWTLFRQATAPTPQRTGWNSQQVWLGHAALSAPGIHLSAETIARGRTGQADVQTTPFSAWIDDWVLTSQTKQDQDALSALELEASAEEFSYRLNLLSDGPLIFHGQSGFSQKSEQGQASYYYSQPFFSVSGQLDIQGKSVEVTGQAWLDREWSSQPLAATQDGWDWFSLHLADGDKVMLFRLRDSAADDYYSGTWIGADGETSPLAPTDVSFKVLKNSQAKGRSVPTHWALEVPSKALKIETTPLNTDSWMNTSISYWEGPISFSGTHTGVGYLEMTGYDASD